MTRSRSGRWGNWARPACATQGEDYSIAGMNAAHAISAAPPPALRAEGVAKRFGARRALAGVTLEAPAAAAIALVGANGAGKTTFLKCVLDLCACDSGRIEVF